jgi:hypothetical protein
MIFAPLLDQGRTINPSPSRPGPSGLSAFTTASSTCMVTATGFVTLYVEGARPLNNLATKIIARVKRGSVFQHRPAGLFADRSTVM